MHFQSKAYDFCHTLNAQRNIATVFKRGWYTVSRQKNRLDLACLERRSKILFSMKERAWITWYVVEKIIKASFH